MSKKIHALYKGDAFISLGTYAEISKETGISLKHLHLIKSNRNHRQKKGIKTAERNGFILIEIEDIKDNELIFVEE